MRSGYMLFAAPEGTYHISCSCLGWGVIARYTDSLSRDHNFRPAGAGLSRHMEKDGAPDMAGAIRVAADGVVDEVASCDGAELRHLGTNLVSAIDVEGRSDSTLFPLGIAHSSYCAGPSSSRLPLYHLIQASRDQAFCCAFP